MDLLELLQEKFPDWRFRIEDENNPIKDRKILYVNDVDILTYSLDTDLFDDTYKALYEQLIYDSILQTIEKSKDKIIKNIRESKVKDLLGE